jgi:putative tryptophan/tyrosine transport system substrate-binding protein
VTATGRLTRAMQEQTRVIPIVIMGAGDPLAGGLVKSLSHPEGNTTGVTDIFPSLGGKWVELLKQCVPDLTRVALMFNPDRGGPSTREPAVKAGPAFGVDTIDVPVRNGADIERAITSFAAESHGGLIVLPPPFLPSERQAINHLAVRYRLALVYQDRTYAAEGGLLSYGVDLLDMHGHGVPPYVDRILRGELRGRCFRRDAPRRHLRGTHSQGREAGRLACATVHEG